ncbi:hypothetical protein KCU91_g3272, partial [Aureobasidium melanogenum]
MQDNLSPNEDVPMGDSVPDTLLDTVIFDEMDEHSIQHSPLETGSQSGSLAYDPFFTSDPSAQVNSFVDSAGHELMYHSPDGVFGQTPGYLNYDYAAQTPGPCTNFTGPSPLAQTTTSWPLLSSPMPQPQQTSLNYPTPASIPSAATPEVQIPKTPTKSGKKARKAKRITQNKQTKEFVCPVCGRISACASNLEEHMLTHTGVKDYFCTYVNEKGETCHKRFARPWGLTRHCHDVHKVEVKVTKRRGVKYIGQSPGNGTPNNNKNNNNKKAHTLDNPPLPSTAAEDAIPLAQHSPIPNVDRIRIITSGPEGPCLCAPCNLAFPQGNELMEHNHFVHGFPVNPYCGCDLCHEWFTLETSVDDGSTFFSIYGSNDDNMEVEASDNDFKLDPMLRNLGNDNSGFDIGMMDACMFPIADTPTMSINADFDMSSPSPSPIASIDEESPILTLPPANPYADERSAAWARIAENDIVTYDSEGFAWHSCSPVSPTTFYALMGLDYNNMTDEQRRAYLGGA